MRVIFLDFDGVILPLDINSLVADSTCVTNLNLITQSTGAKLVISSSWRDLGLTECQRLLKEWGVIGDAIDITPTDQTWTGHYKNARPKEIRSWLDSHADIIDFVILDDEGTMPGFNRQFVKTRGSVGLTLQDVNKAIVILNN